ncbi:Gfo/Idh/MocA family protein [Nocardiopsis sp. MG754419]|uniref:Gfo/Idh/MocA family protein n=1 Tax=Nocardiopsis sp. MG754419 TaxID=2259865 RepID=UPI001BAB2671|nr:Gfo/Idh/MocA family oxidoreductase [Nocardiopsis sp. MG754419]MBR8743437.1 gfo/Idh/MocA family oxidoreductase [Nocardiopsis sp. MG754419]
MERVEPLTVGAVGCSDVAWRRTLPTFQAHDGIRLVCVAGRDPDRTRRYAERFSCAAEHGYEDLLRRDDVEAVYLSLPGALHAEWVERSLLAGKHVLVEKPYAVDPQEASRLEALAARTGLVLLENYAFVHHPMHDHVRRLVDDGAIGEVRSFSSAFTIPPKPYGDIRYHKELTGGTLLDTGVYPLRAAMLMLDADLEVHAAVMRRERERDAVLSGDALLTTPSGVAVHVEFGMEHGYRARYEIHGSEGGLFVDRVFTPPAGHPPVVTLWRQNHRQEFTLEAADQLALLVGVFHRAVRGREAIGTLGERSLRLSMLTRDVARRAVYFDV